MSETSESLSDFVRDNAALAAPPLVPEIRLWLAAEVVPLWERIEKMGTANPPPPYWAFAWPGGQALARYILDHLDMFRTRTVLDFGAGCGLVAIAAAKAGANAVAAEIDPIGAAAIALNIEANDATAAIVTEDMIGRDEGWDLICLGDMCYERPLAERVLPWIDRLARRGAEVLLGDPKRNYFPDKGMTRLASYEVPTSKDLEDREMRETSVYRVEAA